ncbi:toprim domain-containing protein [Falsirhodobacter halotolerans]|uniref:toprim domain-containing protein n=1 Tax=Falsirhodobacter halotolerans TaxID=1146892 RepID=UPI001FD19261|nr:toprim domain-containing protein [Falsirhodobacter halotolerans]MCJ8138587.1 toprim domain-containing protein [Falsirhodobacter halotolerans]
MMLDDAMREACQAIGIDVPRAPAPGRWVKSAVVGKGRQNTSGRVLIFDDRQGGIAHNWATGQQQRFSVRGPGAAPTPIRRDPAKEQRDQADQRAIEATCQRIVRAARPQPHPYLNAKGFPDEEGLVCEDLHRHLPAGRLGEVLAKAMPEGPGPFLIVPGRIGDRITTVQFIAPDGAKKNILRGIMGGASHRIATGRETWVCEGIATALTIRAALRFMGRSATVLAAFSASNVAKVAAGIPGSIIAADNDKPVEQFGGLGTGEFYARRSGLRWSMPPAAGDFNDMMQQDGLRAVAVHLRGVSMG